MFKRFDGLVNTVLLGLGIISQLDPYMLGGFIPPGYAWILPVLVLGNIALRRWLDNRNGEQ